MDHKLNADGTTAVRYQTQEAAQIDVFGKRGIIYCRMGNLSVSGAFFEMVSSTYVPKTKDFVRITINLKKINSTRILYGEVIWCKGNGLGISFLKQKEVFQKISE